MHDHDISIIEIYRCVWYSHTGIQLMDRNLRVGALVALVYEVSLTKV